ncbi:NUDIX hydrolase [Microbacterium aurantiacum]|uniref:NUDIX hydrolase n=1 Tax=Microbacterium aurantiacum TaxID=162393 RepID=UPI000C807319|nr:NUDIX domain-containing protein [Microbacterium aurantiacum]
MSDVLAASMSTLVRDFTPRDAVEQAAQEDFASFFVHGDSPMSRTSGPDHATASCVVFDPALRQTLLVFHGKGRFWVQPGGHLEEGDESIAAGALRELHEETGIRLDAVADASLAYDLDHHSLSSSFGRCASHLDVGIAVIVDRDAEITVSDESEDVRWWPVDALPVELAGGVQRRIQALLARMHDRG